MRPMINSLPLDPVVNFGKVTVSIGYNSTETFIALVTGDGSKLPNPDPDGSFNLVWFNNSTYSDPSDDPNVEIVRCLGRSGDLLSLARAQEGTLASNKNIPEKIYKMLLSPTKKTITDIPIDSQSKIDAHSTLSTGVHGVGGSTVESVSGSTSKVSTHSSTTSSVHGFDSSGNAPAQTHGILKHTGTIGTEGNITFSITGGHAHTGSDSTQVNHTDLTNKGSNTHAQIDTAITASAGHIAANGTSVHGLGTMSTQNADNVSISGGSISGGSVTGLITNLAVADGGTGRGSAVAYAPICGGTTDTSAQQSVTSTGTAGQVLTSNGASALPTFQTPAAVPYVFTVNNGVDQTSAKSQGTTYQNTTGKAIFVSGSFVYTGTGVTQTCTIGPSGPSDIVFSTGNLGSSDPYIVSFSFIVPNTFFYRIGNGSNAITIKSWYEIQLG